MMRENDGKLRVNPIFGHHMIIQRDVAVPIWGTGTDDERVTVRCRGEQAVATVRDGQWNVQIPPMVAGGPFELIIETSSASLVLRDILIGDVWLAGGQSNMEFVLKDSIGAEQEIADADLPMIRFYNVPKIAYEDGDMNIARNIASWKVCSPQTAGQLSAVAYHYAKQVTASQHIPIGIINCNWGGTSASCWISEQMLLDDPELSIYIDEYVEQTKDFDWDAFEAVEGAYNQQALAYNRRAAKGLQGDELGVFPWPPPMSPRSFLRPS